MPESCTTFLKRVPTLLRYMTCAGSEGRYSQSLGSKGLCRFYENISVSKHPPTEVTYLPLNALMVPRNLKYLFLILSTAREGALLQAGRGRETPGWLGWHRTELCCVWYHTNFSCTTATSRASPRLLFRLTPLLQKSLFVHGCLMWLILLFFKWQVLGKCPLKWF